MPELPEVQAHAERLSRQFEGAVLEQFRPISFTVLRTFAPDPVGAQVHPLQRVDRRGKLFLLRFEPVTFVAHLMQGGRLRADPKQAAKPRGGLARWRFEDGTALLLTEPGTERKAGIWVVEGDPLVQEPLLELGPEADTLSRDQLAQLLSGANRRIHGVLRDQSIVAGIGRRLANEICHRAQISPFASANRLDSRQIDRLHAAIGEVIAESLAFERSQEEMVNVTDRPSAVHGRIGEPCPVCGDTIRSVEYRAYTVAYCPQCQTGGKVLADNTTSKFLK